MEKKEKNVNGILAVIALVLFQLILDFFRDDDPEDEAYSKKVEKATGDFMDKIFK